MQHRAAGLFVLAAVTLPWGMREALTAPDKPRTAEEARVAPKTDALPTSAPTRTPKPEASEDDETAIDLDRAPAPNGFVEMYVAGVLPTEGGPAVVLRDADKKKMLPIWVGASEAHSIQLRLERRRFPRPLTHDLLDAIVHDLGGEIVKITLDDMKGETFVGTVFVKRGDKIARYDARASDSIALAVGNGAPIFVSEAIVAKMSSRRADLEPSPGLDDEDEDEPTTPASSTEKPPPGIQTL